MPQKKPPVYAIQIAGEAPEQGVSLVSFVGTPAIGVDFVALSAQASLSVALKADAKKQVLTGPVLIPDKQIARVDPKGQLYYIEFSATVIEQLSDRFHEQQKGQATNLQHETELAGNYCVESWIVTDGTQDKAYALGFTAEQVPVGTWMASYKVPDAQLWADEVETGKVKGFSMEGVLGYTTLSAMLSVQPTPIMSKNPQPAGPNLFARLKARAQALVTSIFLSVLTLEDDSTVDVDDETGEVFSLDEAGTRGELVADGTYTLKDGGELVVKDGKKVDTAAATTTDATTTTTATPPAEKLADATSTDAPTTTETPTAVTMAEITLDTGEVVKHDPISKKLYDSAGQLLKSGKYKTADGVMFKVTTDQWWYETQETLSAQLDASEKEREADKAAVTELKAQLAALEIKLKAKPAAQPLKLAGDKAAESLTATAPSWQQRLAARQGRKAA